MKVAARVPNRAASHRQCLGLDNSDYRLSFSLQSRDFPPRFLPVTELQKPRCLFTRYHFLLSTQAPIGEHTCRNICLLGAHMVNHKNASRNEEQYERRVPAHQAPRGLSEPLPSPGSQILAYVFSGEAIVSENIESLVTTVFVRIYLNLTSLFSNFLCNSR